METTRNHRLDNIKGFLVVLVFFGHLIESFAFYGKGQAAFQFIYFFHMPAFAFCSGYFASVDTPRKKLWTNIAYPYVVFQSLYYLFRGLVLKETITSVTFLTPSWILWYLLSLFFWNMLLPFFDTSKCKCAPLIVAACFLFGLAIGFNPSAGYFLSISRTAVYFPFFLTGYFSKRSTSFCQSPLAKHRLPATIAAIAVVGAVGLFSLLTYPKINASWLYGSYPYSALHYGAPQRLLFYSLAVAMIAALLILFPNRKTPFSYIGKASMNTYLLHGFVVLALGKAPFMHLLPLAPKARLPLLLCLAIALSLLFSTPVVTAVLKPLTRFPLNFAQKKNSP